MDGVPTPLPIHGGADTCLYGSVVGMENLLTLDNRCDTFERQPTGTSSPASCEECEEQRARIECEDCGLVYCQSCDTHRHRKGKLIFHQRKKLSDPVVVRNEDGDRDGSAQLSPTSWNVERVHQWLTDHDLEIFVEEASANAIDGAFLFSERMEQFLETTSNASRGHKKKLLREIQKFKDEMDSTTDRRNSGDNHSVVSLGVVTAHPMLNTKMGTPGIGERRRMGVNLRVNVDPQPAASEATTNHYSPVTSLRSRVNHGQDSITKGRVIRRHSGFSGRENADEVQTPNLSINTSEARRGGRNVVAQHSNDDKDVKGQRQRDQSETRPGVRTDLRSMRQALGGLDLDIMQVKQEEKVAASFDFSATGRLQTQGFEINTRGIANVPFPNQPSSKNNSLATREYLLILHELGHGAGGKVYKALYIPTFKFVAIKVIRVYDQKKRHQMVRELKSLYVNFVSITDTASKAACDELVIFYDAYTNPEIGSVSIVLEYMDGGSLEDGMQAGRYSSEKELANLAYCVLKGLAFLHEHHQLHRDIKLSNMLINRQGQVKISDFGISRDLESTLAKAMTFTGTLLYMAPERISGGMYSYPSDIWSFGLAVMACAIGKLPVPTKEGYWGVVHAVQEQPSPKLDDYGAHFSLELCDFIDQCLQKNPMMRPPAVKLLEHPFIRNNYSPHQRVHPLEQPLDASIIEKNMKELDQIAVKVEVWCKEHVNMLLSPTAACTDGSIFQQVSTQEKIECLAHQLQLPVETVAPKFTFLDKYGK